MPPTTIVPTQELRYTHVAFVLVLSFLLFPLATRFRNRIRWWDVVPGLSASASSSTRSWAARTSPTAPPRPTACDVIARHRLHHPAAGGDAPHHRLIMPVVALLFIAYAMARPASAAAVDPPRLRAGAAGRPSVHHAGRHLRHRGRRLRDADHPVHDLRRVPAAIRRRQVLHRLLDGADGRQAEQRRPHRGAVVVPARRPVGIGRRHHGDDRRRRLSDDEARPASRRMPPAACWRPAGSAPSSRRRCSAPPPS